MKSSKDNDMVLTMICIILGLAIIALALAVLFNSGRVEAQDQPYTLRAVCYDLFNELTVFKIENLSDREVSAELFGVARLGFPGEIQYARVDLPANSFAVVASSGGGAHRLVINGSTVVSDVDPLASSSPETSCTFKDLAGVFTYPAAPATSEESAECLHWRVPSAAGQEYSVYWSTPIDGGGAGLIYTATADENGSPSLVLGSAVYDAPENAAEFIDTSTGERFQAFSFYVVYFDTLEEEIMVVQRASNEYSLPRCYLLSPEPFVYPRMGQTWETVPTAIEVP